MRGTAFEQRLDDYHYFKKHAGLLPSNYISSLKMKEK